MKKPYKMTVKITKINDDYGCFTELTREGLKEGDIITGIYNPINKALDFKSPKTGVDCVAWIGSSCKRYTERERWNDFMKNRRLH